MNIREFEGYLFYEDGTIYNSKGKELKPRFKNDKFEIRLSTKNGIKYHMYHRLRYYLFIGGFDLNDKDTCVVAIDGNYQNLQLSNFKLMKRSIIISRKNHKRTKLTEDQVKQLKSEYKGRCGVNQHYMTDYRSYSFLAEKYGVSKSTISWIINDYKKKK